MRESYLIWWPVNVDFKWRVLKVLQVAVSKNIKNRGVWEGDKHECAAGAAVREGRDPAAASNSMVRVEAEFRHCLQLLCSAS